MLTKLKWWLKNMAYCTKCHNMTSHKKTIFGDKCKKCNTSKCDRDYYSIIEKMKSGKSMRSNDYYTHEFMKFLANNYYTNSGLLVDCKTDQFETDYTEIYVKFIRHYGNIQIQKANGKYSGENLLKFLALSICFLATVAIIIKIIMLK